MVTFTDSQAGEMLARLIRIQESATAIDEERLYWKGVAEKLRETVDERERAIDWFDKRIKFAEEELAELAATVNDYANESVRLKQVAHQNAVAADGFAREVAMLREQNRIQSNTNSCYNWLLHNLDGM